jgi:hypothetical protein
MAARLGTAARPAGVGAASRAGERPRALPGARDVAGAARRSVPSGWRIRPRVPALARRGKGAGRLPRGPLCAPSRPPPPDRRSPGQGGARERHEEHRGAPGPGRESKLREKRSGARRPLPPSSPTHPARSAASARPCSHARRTHRRPASSAGSTIGADVESRFAATRGEPEVALARTWLLKTGWRRQGLVDPSEAAQLDKGSLPPT